MASDKKSLVDLPPTVPEAPLVHSGLVGLGNDDHPQYLTQDRAAEAFSARGHIHTETQIQGLSDFVLVHARNAFASGKGIKFTLKNDVIQVSVDGMSHSNLTDLDANSHPQYLLAEGFEEYLFSFISSRLQGTGYCSVEVVDDKIAISTDKTLTTLSEVKEAIKVHDELNDPHRMVEKILSVVTPLINELHVRILQLEEIQNKEV
jgi:hypothetical protein